MALSQTVEVRAWEPEERKRMYELLTRYRGEMMSFLRGRAKGHHPKALFSVFMMRVQRIRVDLRRKMAEERDRRNRGSPPLYPLDVLDKIFVETRRVIKEAVEALREFARDRQIGGLSDHDVAELIIEDAKATSEHLIAENGTHHVTYRSVPAERVLAQLRSLVPNLVLPDGDYAYKGGVARVALKLYAREVDPERFQQKLLAAELPLADRDAIVGPGIDMWEAAREMGVDASGIERRKMFRFSDPACKDVALLDYFKTRDIDMNEVLLTSRELIFTPEALESTFTGIIHARSREQTLFGSDVFYYMRREYQTSRALHRLLKMVIEGKAYAFEMRRYNFEVPVGIYWLGLTRKWYGKRDFGDRLTMLYNFAVALGQTHAPNPKQFVIELLEQYSNFSFLTSQDAVDIALWILEKWYTLVHKHLRRKFDIHLTPDWQSEDPTMVRMTPCTDGVSPADQEEAVELIDFLVRYEIERTSGSLSALPS